MPKGSKPAFPGKYIRESVTKGPVEDFFFGMSYRQYLAAHAPAPTLWYRDELKRKIGDEPLDAQVWSTWPWAWADMVLEAEEPKP